MSYYYESKIETKENSVFHSVAAFRIFILELCFVCSTPMTYNYCGRCTGKKILSKNLPFQIFPWVCSCSCPSTRLFIFIKHFFFCQNHLTLPFQSLFVHLRWFSIFSVFFFDSAAEISHRIWKNCLKRTQKPTKPFHFPSYSIQFDSIETKDLEEKKT